MHRYLKNKRINFLSFLIDILVIALSHFFSNFLTSRAGGDCVSWISIIYYAVPIILLFFIFDFYTYVDDTIYNNSISIVITVVAVAVLKVVISLFVGFNYYGSLYSPIMFFSLILFLSFWRFIFSYLLLKKSERVLIIESIEAPTRMARKMKYYDKHPELIWYCMVDETNTDDVDTLLNKYIPEYDVVFISSHISNDLTRSIIRRAIELNKSIRKIGSLHNVALRFGVLRNTTDTPVIEMVRLGLTKRQMVVKRIFDIILSTLLIILTSPLQAVIAVLINLDSPGGAIYRQERYTINKKVFTLFKFRTMRSDAEKNGAQLATKNDDRLTKFGVILRKSHLDELPQLFNVLRGDMSFVGPRPERPVFADVFCEQVNDYDLRYKVKAGITGYAQVYGNYSSRASDKILMDIIYMSNYSIYLDVKLMLMTVRQIFIHDRAEGLDVELEALLDDPEKEFERINASFAGREKKNEEGINNNSGV